MNDFTKKLARAKQTVAAMDKHDGGSEVERLPLDVAMRTVIMALVSGLRGRAADDSSAFEALVMMDQIELRYRPADHKKGGSFLFECAAKT